MFSLSYDNGPFKLEIFEYLVAILQFLRLGFFKFRILEILNFHPCLCFFLLEFGGSLKIVPSLRDSV